MLGPAQTAENLAAYATSRGYDVLSTINASEGFWVNAMQPFSISVTSRNWQVTVSTPAGPNIVSQYALQQFYQQFSSTFIKGWNLASIGETKTPSEFNVAIGSAPATPIPINLTTLWVWDSALMNFYFYAPSLEANGTLSSYITSNSYLDFTISNKTLGQGVGFWLNKP